ncbi:MAG: sigma-70 family RNA polymerase sigma factor [Planctomycetes bacterium]|jgi:RNA polymerase sigma-70 factor (ECF subfamily)|nr:sigma-70 family RNA polymerase sigma factor [Planctomycetota bacterium]
MPPRPTTASDPLTAVGAGALQRDRALLVRWQQGERAAGAELLDHYTGFVHQLLQRLGMHGPDRDECWQELVLKVMQQLPDLPQRLRTSFAGYLAWQVRDLVRNRRRQLRRQPVLPAAEPSAAADAAPRTAFWEAMHRCADQLPPRERQVFELRFLGGADLAECATTIGSNANAIAQAVFRLVRRLRDCLQRSGFDHPGDHR